jgi:hypothetical protein
VEFGLLYSRMQEDSDSISDFFCRDNQDRILLLASRLGWTVREMEPWGRDWFWCEMEKRPAPA